MLTDSNHRIRSITLAERKAAQARAPVWYYSFDWETPVFGGKLKAFHALEARGEFGRSSELYLAQRLEVGDAREFVLRRVGR